MEDYEAPSVAICIPSHDMVASMTMYDLSRMMLQVGAAANQGFIDEVGVNISSGTYIHRSREALAETVLKREPTPDYILWMDADMRFPKDALFRLLQHDKDVVGINYAKRGIPPEYVAFTELATAEDESSVRCETRADSEGLEKVEGIGFGLVLMKTHVFNRVASERPWFWYEIEGENGRHVGEDVYFCRLLNDAGIDIYVDHDLSKECAHLGQFEYQPIHAEDYVESQKPNLVTP